MNSTSANGITNGYGSVTSSHSRAPLRHGVYVPTVTFFYPETEDVDIPTIRLHVVRLVEAGVVGLVTLGSIGEAVHLTRGEKVAIIRAHREALDEAGYTNIPVICGASESSTRGTIELCQLGYEAGADYAMVISPSYFRAAMDESTLEEYFMTVADESPIPIIIYNYPGAVAGIDLDSDFLIKLGQHPNIIGTKFTCGNIGKLTRVATAMDATTTYKRGSGYMALGGMADITAQIACSGGSGIIAGAANVMPRLCVKVWKLWAEGKYEDSMLLQTVLSKGDWILTKGGVPGTKQAIQLFYGYGGYARKPLKRLGPAEVKAMSEKLTEIMKLERSL